MCFFYSTVINSNVHKLTLIPLNTLLIRLRVWWRTHMNSRGWDTLNIINYLVLLHPVPYLAARNLSSSSFSLLARQHVIVFGVYPSISNHCTVGSAEAALENTRTNHRFRRVLFVFLSACGRIVISILKFSQQSKN